MKSRAVESRQAFAIALMIALAGLSATSGCAMTEAAESGTATAQSSSRQWPPAASQRRTMIPPELVGLELTGPAGRPDASASVGAAYRVPAVPPRPTSRTVDSNIARGESPLLIQPPARLADHESARPTDATSLAPKPFPLAPIKPAQPAARLANRSAPPAVLHVNTTNFDQQVLRSDAPVLVDFYATWCGPCQAMAPAIQQLASENPHVKVVKVDIDDSPELAARYGIRSIPSLLVFKEGQVVATQKGAASQARLKSLIDL